MPKKRVKKHSGKTKFGNLIMIAPSICLLGVVGLFVVVLKLISHKQPVLAPTSFLPTETPIVIPLNYKGEIKSVSKGQSEYENKYYGFSFSYPSTYTLKDSFANEQFGTFLSIDLEYVQNNDKNYGDSFNLGFNISKDDGTPLSELIKRQGGDSTDITIDGIPGIKTVQKWETGNASEDGISETIYFKHDGYIFFFQSWDPKLNKIGWTDQANKIISSIRFLK